MKLLAAVALVALALLPAASGQLPVDIPATGVTLFAPNTVLEVPAGGTLDVPVVVELGCGSIAANSGDGTVVLTAENLPAGVTAAPASIVFEAGPECFAGAGILNQTGTLTLAATSDAAGLVTSTFTITGTIGNTAGFDEAAARVGYRAGHTVTADIDFPAQVTGPTLTFNVTVTVTANARSMVMFERLAASEGSLDGLQSTIMDTPTKVFEVTFTAPAEEWTSSNVTFHNYSHYLLASGEAGAAQLAQDYKWTFENADAHAHDDEKKDSPGAGILLATGLLALAFVARRQA